MYLSQDIRSVLKPTIIYGKQGDAVSVISYHGSVAIVENVSGERFAVKAELLTGKIVKATELPEKPNAVESKPEPKTSAKKRVKVSTANAGSSLF